MQQETGTAYRNPYIANRTKLHNNNSSTVEVRFAPSVKKITPVASAITTIMTHLSRSIGIDFAIRRNGTFPPGLAIP
jgi:hypothetical protein